MLCHELDPAVCLAPVNPHPTMSTYSLSALAYTKIILHAAKFPSSRCIGLLVGPPPTSSTESATVQDAIPLLHHWADLSMAMEAALQFVSTRHGRTENCKVVSD